MALCWVCTGHRIILSVPYGIACRGVRCRRREVCGVDGAARAASSLAARWATLSPTVSGQVSHV